MFRSVFRAGGVPIFFDVDALADKYCFCQHRCMLMRYKECWLQSYFGRPLAALG